MCKLVPCFNFLIWCTFRGWQNVITYSYKWLFQGNRIYMPLLVDRWPNIGPVMGELVAFTGISPGVDIRAWWGRLGLQAAEMSSGWAHGKVCHIHLAYVLLCQLTPAPLSQDFGVNIISSMAGACTWILAARNYDVLARRTDAICPKLIFNFRGVAEMESAWQRWL